MSNCLTYINDSTEVTPTSVVNLKHAEATCSEVELQDIADLFTKANERIDQTLNSWETKEVKQPAPTALPK